MARLTSLNVISAQEHLRDQVANALRAALIAGELRPGLIYSAPALASEFGVSATPVREAMLDLAREGLVEAVRNKGFRITELTEQDLDDFTELRAMIEVPTVGRIAGMGKTRELEALRPLASAIVDAAREHDILGYLEADRRFHLELLALGGNRRLVEEVANLRKRSRLFGLNRLAETGQLVTSAEEHVQLLDLMVAGDARRAEVCMLAHMSHVRSLWADGDPTGDAVGQSMEGDVPEAEADGPRVRRAYLPPQPKA
ncbi:MULTISPECIES: GntR family transcriptional regulator [unclassified Streptomyces]|uniref:GntR family transcriptional regulator n=1 Tax=unclassified Streptomyces TaxID=2593676 RepID=UPI00081BB1AA|nr:MULTISPECIES: GntR family transcriptional regulator [unclassified Streptomyces]MYQ53662.1 FCD domain-containing protein [Streptomyces sp. SID4941]SCE09863.1 transcriptional regulator, GntR family [Streptomyces sp. PalvLS-984]SDB93509.1 DNA-binding transcriptional regulator, GntR family [Streptomyces sp. AmelKG-A3]